jgi:uncharacterized protein (TIGR03067 family)
MLKVYRFAALSTLACLLAISVNSRAAAQDKADAKKLEGMYTITSGERDGKAIQETDLTGSTVRITQDKIVAAGKDGKEFFSATYTIDTTKTPWVLNMKSTASDAKQCTGLIQRKDDGTVQFIYHLDGGQAPTEF